MCKLIGSLLLVIVSSVACAGSSLDEQYQSAIDYRAKGEYNNAVSALLPVLSAQPNDYLVNLHMGWLGYLKADYAESRRHYRLAIQAEPDSVEPRLGLMLPLMAAEQWIKAEQTAYQIFAIDPHNYYANLRLMVALRKQEKFELGRKQAEKMLSLYPGDPELLNELGMALQGQGRQSEAEGLLRRAAVLRGNER